ncbi:MAG: hypothetical protein IPK55_12170 [Streptococcus sp.]|nr:hypothetical protein [Streptococcus sp.]
MEQLKLLVFQENSLLQLHQIVFNALQDIFVLLLQLLRYVHQDNIAQQVLLQQQHVQQDHFVMEDHRQYAQVVLFQTQEMATALYVLLGFIALVESKLPVLLVITLIRVKAHVLLLQLEISVQLQIFLQIHASKDFTFQEEFAQFVQSIINAQLELLPQHLVELEPILLLLDMNFVSHVQQGHLVLEEPLQPPVLLVSIQLEQHA